ncbi:hypothetical protein [Actinoplanes sp. G11-F43]|uniref:hypothetical protein n=1 Tax=Actinoplanes sp. G11-F43 TaxID=3424130 RepID=UPI003D32BC3D
MSRQGMGLLRRMEAEWQALVVSRTAGAALTRWAATEPALAPFTDLQAVRTATEDRLDKDRSDEILAALARLAARDGGDDELAARVLLQLMLAGAVRLIRRITAVTGDPVEAEADVLTELSTLIRTYPWRRRPKRIAANLLLDCQQRLSRAARRDQGSVPVGLLPVDENEPDPRAEHEAGERVEVIDLFLWARRTGVLSGEEALLLAAHRVDEAPVRSLTGRFGRSATGLFALRSQAEQRLRTALAHVA